MSSQSKIIIGIVLSLGMLFGLSMLGTKDTAEKTKVVDSQLLKTQADDWIKGNREAKVVFVEYLDFECEACRAYYPLIKQANDEFKNDVQFVARYFPNPGHKNAMTAALAVEAAGQQGKYWEMHDLVFENQKNWGEKQKADPTLFEAYAKKIGLDMEKFKTDTKSNVTEARVQRDFEAGIALGIQGTPTFFLDGKKIDIEGYDDLKNKLRKAVGRTVAAQPNTEKVSNSTSSSVTGSSTTELQLVDLPVPYVSQLPDGNMVQPWLKACEEASITMVEQFYLKNNAKIIEKEESKKLMNTLFAWENSKLGYNDDTDASTTARIINEYSSMNATVKRYPTLEEIKEELRNGRPVISLHYGTDLNNPYLHFKADGPRYHVIVLKGYNEKTKEFISHEPGTFQYSGDNYAYSYETIMNSLRDYNIKTKKATGTPVVLFTSPKILAKTQESKQVYLIEGNTKRLISSESVYKNRRLSKNIIQIVDSTWLNTFSTSTPLTQ